MTPFVEQGSSIFRLCHQGKNFWQHKLFTNDCLNKYDSSRIMEC